ncbi:MAG: GTPase, partial [Balneolaceae bacterium]|nr:GTPase [Balneolaceae bacterium]
DIPGIIEDAHQGKGLGLQFLRHIERNNVLLFMVGCDTEIEEEYSALLHELKAYRPDLHDKPRILAITKMDLKEGYELESPLQIEDDVEVIRISSATGYGMDELKELIWGKLQNIEQGESL